MLGWDVNNIITFGTMFFLLGFVIYATRPGCRWIFKEQNASEEKARKYLRKISVIGLILGVIFAAAATLFRYLAHVN